MQHVSQVGNFTNAHIEYDQKQTNVAVFVHDGYCNTVILYYRWLWEPAICDRLHQASSDTTIIISYQTILTDRGLH